MSETAQYTRERPRRTRHRRPPPPPLDERCALFLDIDGTLLEFAPTPDGVVVDRALAHLLDTFRRALGGAVALITGRTLVNVDRLFGGTALLVAGLHGSERRSADGSVHRHERAAAELKQLRDDMARFAARHKGLLFEDKGASFAIHYRRAPALASFVHRTLRRHAAHASIVGWQLQRGKGILELRAPRSSTTCASRRSKAERPFLSATISPTNSDSMRSAPSAAGRSKSVPGPPAPRFDCRTFRRCANGSRRRSMRWRRRALRWLRNASTFFAKSSTTSAMRA